MISLRIEGAGAVIESIAAARTDQIPYAFALSLTRTVQIAQKENRAGLSKFFTLRRPSFIEQGVRIQAATKRNLAAVVQDVDPFMDLQEEGGAKIAGGKYLLFSYRGKVCIPLLGARKQFGALVPKELYPETVMASGAGFIRNSAAGIPIMYRRVTRGRYFPALKRTLGATSGIQPLYALVPSWAVRKRWNFVATASVVIEREWPQQFAVAFQEAVGTAR